MIALSDLLLISQSKKVAEQLSSALSGAFNGEIMPCPTAENADLLLREREFGAILISPPINAGDLCSYAKDLSKKSSACVLVILPENEKNIQKYEDSGIFVITKPISRQIIINSVRLAMVARKRLLIIMDEHDRLKSKIEENRLVDRAKCVLIQYLRLTEPQAHRYIEKQAMDMRTSKMDVALGILKTYDS